MKKYFVIEADVSESLERLCTVAYNKAWEMSAKYSLGYAQGVADALEFAVRRGEVDQIQTALRDIIVNEDSEVCNGKG